MIKQRVMWVDDETFKSLPTIQGWNFYCSENESNQRPNKITISYDEPEKSGTITESEFDEAVGLGAAICSPNSRGWDKKLLELKQKLFGAKNVSES